MRAEPCQHLPDAFCSADFGLPIQQAAGFRGIGDEKLLVTVPPREPFIMEFHANFNFKQGEEFQQRATVAHATADVEGLPAHLGNLLYRG